MAEDDAYVWAGDGSERLIRHGNAFASLEEFTVEAWVHSSEKRPDRLEALLSKWRPRDAFDGFSAFDAGATDGLESSGYFGAVFDGRYVYFSPEQHNSLEQHGIVLRLDTHGDFYAAASYSAYDAQETDGLVTKGFYGAVFDGTYVYFVPRQCGDHYHSRILRYDPRRPFKENTAWEAFDVGQAHSQQSAAFDGRYIYFAPGFSGDPAKEDTLSGEVIRYDTTGDFKAATSYSSLDTRRFFGPGAACFDGATFDGRYVYLVPLQTGMAVRFDTLGHFADPGAWQVFDGTSVGMGMCVGAVFDGRFLYYVAYGHPKVIRFDTTGDFSDRTKWTAYNAAMTGGLDTGGFDGGFFDGRFVCFIAFVAKSKADGSNYIHANFLRLDPSGDFADPTSWRAVDAAHTDGLYAVGYNGGAFDGRFFYCAPWRDNASRNQPGNAGVHGRVLRYDTVGAEASFSLRYSDCGHNGGLTAAVPGPNFIVNTVGGARSAAAHQGLEPGWHHLAGTYDGGGIRLYVDGALVAQGPGGGAMVQNSLPLAVGHIQDGLGHFCGEIDQVRIAKVAWGTEQIAAIYRRLVGGD